MTESDHQLMQHVLDSNKAMQTSLYQLHGVVSSIHQRQEDFIRAHATYVRATDDRQDDHSQRIDETAAQIARWKAQASLVLGVASFVGLGGFLSMIAVVVKLYSN